MSGNIFLSIFLSYCASLRDQTRALQYQFSLSRQIEENRSIFYFAKKFVILFLEEKKERSFEENYKYNHEARFFCSFSRD
jgi:hypothetical protein